MLINHYLHHQREFQIKFRHILLILAICFAGWQFYQYQTTFDNCLQLVTEIHRNLETLKIEIHNLQSSMQMVEVIYE